MKNILCFFCLCFMITVVAQPVHKHWDKRYGGTGYDHGVTFDRTKDGGYIIAGNSYSGISGDKTEFRGGNNDFWIVKTYADGTMQWEKTYGTTTSEHLHCGVMATNGDYIIAGGTFGGSNDGDKTDSSRGRYDWWIIRVDTAGNKVWDKTFGGSDDDTPMSIQTTYDNGFIIAGFSISPRSGDKTKNNWGSEDYWVVKIDSAGNKQWDKRYGGYGTDIALSVVCTIDSGYLLGGVSHSSVGGDKTGNSYGSGDLWVIKIDSIGNIIWDKTYGGESDEHLTTIIATRDGGYMFSLTSSSDIGGDKSDTCRGLRDFWVLKTDSSGNKLWDKTYGGNANEDFSNSIGTYDGGYLIVGESSSEASGDKSESSLNGPQTWVLKLDSIGGKQWDMTVLASKYSYEGKGLEVEGNAYVICSSTFSGIGYNVSEPNRDNSEQTPDYWLVKFGLYPLLVENLSKGVDIQVYPNPSTAFINVGIRHPDLKDASYTITDVAGKIVYSKYESDLYQQYIKTIDIQALPTGVYNISVNTEGGRVVKTIVRE